MCGIVGIVSAQVVGTRLLEGLKCLEYRGYDSAGIATIDGKQLHTRHGLGKLHNLEALLSTQPIAGTIGIAHTRWATHGQPSLANCHPHGTQAVSLVHNGIIENYTELKEQLLAQGYAFRSQTDSEVLALLIDSHYKETYDPLQATQAALKKVEGAYAIAALFLDHPDALVVARYGSPLAIGHSNTEMYVASDALALAPFTQQVTYLEEGDVAVLTKTEAMIYDRRGIPCQRARIDNRIAAAAVTKGPYKHYMAKEIHEQPDAVQATLAHYLTGTHDNIDMALPLPREAVKKITIVACGTSFYASMIAKNWIETLARISVEVDIASEFRYREPPFIDNNLCLFISQSGETADTLAALKYAKEAGQKTMAIVNVPNSSIARLVDQVVYTQAGPEIGVASTKGFTTQLAALACIAVHLMSLSPQEKARTCQDLAQAPSLIQQVLLHEPRYKAIAQLLAARENILYLGRGVCFPLALEGALKLKELSYIHAEAFAAGEMKHGPIALIDHQVPVVILAPSGRLFEKTVSNAQEVLARGGKVIMIGDQEGVGKVLQEGMERIIVPQVPEVLIPFVYTVPLQLLAYHTAVLRGTDVDQPRNLAKSVTVE